jgi:hypothetical protein
MVLGLGLAGASLVAPSADAAPLAQPVAPSNCKVTPGLTGSLGTFADVAPTTPHAAEINWFAKQQYTLGWSIACYANPTWSLDYSISGSTITITGISAGSTYGVIEESPFRNAYNTLPDLDGKATTDDYTVGYLYKPENVVTRGDNAVWAATLMLKAIHAVDNSIVVTALNNASYATTFTMLDASKWALKPGSAPAIAAYPGNTVAGADDKCGTADDRAVVWVDSTSSSFVKFGDVADPAVTTPTINQRIVDNRHYGSITALANLIVDVKLDSSCNIISGQRLAEGWEGTTGDGSYWWTWKSLAGSKRDFRPDDTLARADFAAFIYRIAKAAKQIGTAPLINLSLSSAIPGYYSHQEDVYWLHGAGITTGYPDGLYHGELPVYRQDAAAFYFRIQNFLIDQQVEYRLIVN